MADRILWNYLEKLPEQEAAWREWLIEDKHTLVH